MIAYAKNGIFKFRYKFQPYTNAYTNTYTQTNENKWGKFCISR